MPSHAPVVSGSGDNLRFPGIKSAEDRNKVSEENEQVKFVKSSVYRKEGC